MRDVLGASEDDGSDADGDDDAAPPAGGSAAAPLGVAERARLEAELVAREAELAELKAEHAALMATHPDDQRGFNRGIADWVYENHPHLLECQEVAGNGRAERGIVDLVLGSVGTLSRTPDLLAAILGHEPGSLGSGNSPSARGARQELRAWRGEMLIKSGIYLKMTSPDERKVSSAAPLVGQSKQKIFSGNQPPNQPTNQPTKHSLITDHNPK